MGTLRLLLALIVILAHTPSVGYRGMGGSTAVQCFYMVSGFFMALILSEKYIGKGETVLFYSNRFLRIFSIYWLFLAINIGLSFVNFRRHQTGTLERWIQYWPTFTRFDVVALTFSNIFLLGHDWFHFAQLGSGGLHLITSELPDPLMGKFFFVPQAWSLGVEIMFYILAPFLVRRRWWVIALVVLATMGIRYTAASHGLSHYEWFNGFFPSELGMFMLGALGYKAYARFHAEMRSRGGQMACVAVFAAVILFPFYESDLDSFFNGGHLILYGALCFGIPALFVNTAKVKWDRAIGELSYPVYLCHESFVQTLSRVGILGRHPAAMVFCVIAGSCGLGALTVRYFDNPINRFRDKRVRQAKAREQREEPLKLQTS